MSYCSTEAETQQHQNSNLMLLAPRTTTAPKEKEEGGKIVTIISRQSTPTTLEPLPHALKAPPIRDMDLGHLALPPFGLIPLNNPHQLGRIELTIRPRGLNHAALLLEREILPRIPGIDNLPIQRQHLIMTYGPGVGEIHDARLRVLGHGDRQRQQVVQDRVGVGDVDHARVLRDLGHEVARVQVIADGHAEAEDERGRVGFQDVFDPRFGVGVEARAEVGRVGFLEGRRGEVRVVGRVLGGVDAWLRSEQGV